MIRIQGETNESTITVGDFHTPLSEMHYSAPCRKSPRTQLNSIAPLINWIQLTSVDYFTQQ